MSELTIGVWGLDHPHAQGHLKALQACDGIARLRIWDADPDRLTGALGAVGEASGATSPQELLKPGAVDAMVVLLPPRDAGPATLQAVQAGLNVYGDKPGAATVETMAQICEAAAANQVHYCPCYPWRISPVAREVKRLIDGGVIGPVWSFDAKWLTSQVALRGPDHWLFDRQAAGGGILAWLGCHWIDLIAYLVGPLADVCARVATRCPEAVSVEDTASVILSTASGAIGTLRAGYVHNPFHGYEDSDLCLSFEGAAGSIHWPVDGGRGFRLRSRHEPHREGPDGWIQPADTGPGAEGYAADFLAAFVRAVQATGAPPATETDALAVLRVLQGAYESSREGRRVSL